MWGWEYGNVARWLQTHQANSWFMTRRIEPFDMQPWAMYGRVSKDRYVWLTRAMAKDGWCVVVDKKRLRLRVLAARRCKLHIEYDYESKLKPMPRPTLIVRIYKDREDKFRWAIKRSGRVLADSGEGYSSRAKLLKTFTRMFASISAEMYRYDDETKPKPVKVVKRRARPVYGRANT